MPIEFRCRRCQKLLRTPDDTAGKQAQCPQCGEVQSIPSAAPPPPQQLPTGPFAAPPPAADQPGPAAYNPYQSPQAASWPQPPSGTAPTRNGPAWEAKGPSPGSFLETFKSFFTDVAGFFSTMRLQGGLGLPLLHLFICGMIGGLGYGAQQAAFAALGVAMPGNMQGDGPQGPAFVIGMFLGSFCAMAIVAVVMSFVTAAVYHVMLTMLGGANEGFEATFRVVAYTSSHCFLMYLIPCCGSYIGSLASLVLSIIGLANAHSTSGWRAAGAVLIPMAFCCLVGVVLGVALVSMTPN